MKSRKLNIKEVVDVIEMCKGVGLTSTSIQIWREGEIEIGASTIKKIQLPNGLSSFFLIGPVDDVDYWLGLI